MGQQRSKLLSICLYSIHYTNDDRIIRKRSSRQHFVFHGKDRDADLLKKVMIKHIYELYNFFIFPALEQDRTVRLFPYSAKKNLSICNMLTRFDRFTITKAYCL